MRIPPLYALPPFLLPSLTAHRPAHSALESTLLSVLSALEAEMVFIRNLVGGLLAELEDDIDHDRFKRLLHYSRRLTSFQNRARLVSFPGTKGARACALCSRCDSRFKKHWRRCSSKVGGRAPSHLQFSSAC